MIQKSNKTMAMSIILGILIFFTTAVAKILHKIKSSLAQKIHTRTIT